MLPRIAPGLAGQFVSGGTSDYCLVLTADALELRPAVGSGFSHGPVRVDLESDDIRRRIKGGGRELLARAAGLKPRSNLRVLDATAGLGRDAAVLAGLGAQVVLNERSPIVHALLEDGLRRATSPIASHLRLLPCQDSTRYLLSGGEVFDVIYLDPMFPERGKAALAAKELQSLRRLLGADEDVPALLAAALPRARQRVVVKRHPTAPLVDGPAPSHQLKGARVRYDVYRGSYSGTS